MDGEGGRSGDGGGSKLAFEGVLGRAVVSGGGGGRRRRGSVEVVCIVGAESTFAILEAREEVEGDREGMGEIAGESENGTSGRIGDGESID